jgi:hypothetical protein
LLSRETMWGLHRGNSVKVSSSEWALISPDWSPYKKGKFS